MAKSKSIRKFRKGRPIAELVAQIRSQGGRDREAVECRPRSGYQGDDAAHNDYEGCPGGLINLWPWVPGAKNGPVA
jgi:hypothetical protein